jgi:formate hydrogenlyase subunit 3/multisubunit Na+/H+ antiporter MnhD subunit
MFGRESGSLDFSGFSTVSGVPGLAGTAFVLAVIGFGTKAGFMPLHVWLPEAHPAAPSHVSAVMSGVMIKTGIYGLIRTLTFLGTPPTWWGWTLVCIGAASGVLGVLFALAQHDLKRLLAYHSVENIGIIALGLGVGTLGLSYGSPIMAFLGFAGGLLHVVNHAVFKSLLFLSAGSVLHATGTRDIEHLGGLLKRMPTTGLVFLVGSVAICGLPPLNGFVSEFLIYLGALGGLKTASAPAAGSLAGSVIVVGSLALIGGLAVACFTKAFGVVFLGEPRSGHAEKAHEAGLAMRIPMLMLAAICVVIGLSGPFAMSILSPAVAVVTAGVTGGMEGQAIGSEARALWMITAAAAAIMGLVAILALLRSRILSGRSVGSSVTWDCGYLAPTARMQYSASSFADPITRMFGFFLRTRHQFSAPDGLFPVSSSYHSETPDIYREHVYRPAFTAVEKLMARFRWLQHGLLNLYILCIVVSLVLLLVWKLR